MVTKLLIALLVVFPFVWKANAADLEEERAFITYFTKQTFETREDLNNLNAFVAQSNVFVEMRTKNKVSSLTNDERQVLRESWAKLIQLHVKLNVVIEKVNERIDANEDNTFLKDEYFTVLYSAYMAEYRSSIEFIRSMRTIPTIDKVLNEAYADLGIEARSFADFKFEYLNVAKFAQYSGYRVQALANKVDISELSPGIEKDEAYIARFNRFKGVIYTMKNAGRITAHLLFKAYFPIQKNISEWMGDERVARGNEFLINQEQIKKIHTMLKAGDVLIERREWYLSNIGLPGFWPHAALYLGRPEERAHLEEDETVKAWVESLGVSSGSFEELMNEKYPKAYQESLGKDETNHEYRVLEAMSEGVVYTSLEHSANADSLAVLRPKLSNLDIAKGILTSLKYQGRPYDFNFDFRTDSSVVCSELVYYAYQPTKDKNGIIFPVTETLGRPVVTPNNIIKDFTETYGTDKQQYDFILFLDGNDKKREAVFSNMDVLKTTWNRPKWFIFTQNKKN